MRPRRGATTGAGALELLRVIPEERVWLESQQSAQTHDYDGPLFRPIRMNWRVDSRRRTLMTLNMYEPRNKASPLREVRSSAFRRPGECMVDTARCGRSDDACPV